MKSLNFDGHRITVDPQPIKDYYLAVGQRHWLDAVIRGEPTSLIGFNLESLLELIQSDWPRETYIVSEDELNAYTEQLRSLESIGA
jgi:hypothetical protein